MARDQVADIMGELTDMVEGTVKGLGRDLTLNLAAATPKDTGLAAASWLPRAGRPAEPVARNQNTAEGVAIARQAQAQALAALDRYTLRQGQIIIRNSQGYVGALNDGHSGQAPSGFIQRTVEQTARRGPGGRR